MIRLRRRPPAAEAAEEMARRLAEAGDAYPLSHVALTGDCETDCRDACAYPGQFSECEP